MKRWLFRNAGPCNCTVAAAAKDAQPSLQSVFWSFTHAPSRQSAHLRRRVAGASVLPGPAHGHLPRHPALPQHHAEPAAGLRGDGHRHRSPPGDRHRPGRRHRHRAQEPDAGRAGRARWPRSSATSRACCATRWRSRRRTPCGRSWRCRTSSASRASRCCDGGKVVGIVTGRDLRFETPLRRAGQRDHDAARQAHHGARRHHAGRRQGADQQVQARAAAGDQRGLGAEGPDHRQGHHQADQLPERGTRLQRPAARRRRGRRGRGHRGAGRGAGQGRRRRDRGRHRARPQRRRDRAACAGSRTTIRRST